MSAKKRRNRDSKATILPEKKSALPRFINLNLFVTASILIYSMLVWLPTRFLPYFWDSAGFVINATRQLQASGFWPLIINESDFAHPPFFITTLGLLWSTFGEKITVSHAFMFPFLPILMIATYFLGKKWVNASSGVAAAFLVGVAPVVLAEYGVVYIDLPAASLATAAVCLWVYRFSWQAMLVFSMALLTKNTVISLVPLMALDVFLDKKRRTNVRAYLPLLLPLILLCVWYVYHYVHTGWWLVRPGRGTLIPKTIGQLWQSATYVVVQVLTHQHRWLLSGLALLSSLVLTTKKYRKELNDTSLLLPLSGVVGGIGFFTLAGEFGSRYGIFILPFFILASLSMITKAATIVLKNNASSTVAIISLLTMILWIMVWRPVVKSTTNFEYRPPDDLRYQDMIWVFRQSAKYVETYTPAAEVYGAFPESQQLTETYQGYVNTPIDFFSCSEFSYHPNKKQVLYIHPYSPIQKKCAEVAYAHKLQLLQRYEKNGKWVELLEITGVATNSASKEN